MDVYTLGWLAWIGWFLVEEVIGLRTRTPGSTLSEHVWEWFGVTARTAPPQTSTRLRRVALIGFLAWLVVHFLTGGAFV